MLVIYLFSAMGHKTKQRHQGDGVTVCRQRYKVQFW